MPQRARSPCGVPGCPALANGRYCEVHQKEITAQYNRFGRDPRTKLWYGKQWRQIRKAYITEHPLCEDCVEKGRFIPAEEVHHKTPLSQGGTHAYENLRSLCKPCHSRITATEGGRWG